MGGDYLRTLPALCVLGLAVGGIVVAPTPASAAPPRCQGVPATIVGTAARDDITGAVGRDVIVGRGGWDRLERRGGGELHGDGTDDADGGEGDDICLAAGTVTTCEG